MRSMFFRPPPISVNLRPPPPRTHPWPPPLGLDPLAMTRLKGLTGRKGGEDHVTRLNQSQMKHKEEAEKKVTDDPNGRSR